ncbi:inositol monophosphatase family protein [Pseudoruegeria sp. HB172150]|uniref:inositol monophosphatase family protein n=1 Tax=Pseudoruegeria sp. HB172150 TaxID=2721164 RepID=UPI0015549EC3|nr:inositol monophosphatase family protein [Pseudoruegeria sp. HB172150]
MTADLLETASKVAGEVGTFCLARFQDGGSYNVSVKSARDFVSDVDMAAERLARDRLAATCPGIPVVGEEQGGTPGERYWLVDPLDGTTNFLSGLPFWGVSLALMEKGQPVLGAVTAPALGLHLCGGPGGLECHGPLRGCPHRFNALVAVGRNGNWSPSERAAWELQLERDGQTIVSLGSCAISLALVALGRLGGYVERRTRLWDCAAGEVLCRAAGREVVLPGADKGLFVDVFAGAGTRFVHCSEREVTA